MKKMNEQQLTNLEGGKFWGRDCYDRQTGPCTSTTYCAYYALWIQMTEYTAENVEYTC